MIRKIINFINTFHLTTLSAALSYYLIVNIGSFIFLLVGINKMFNIDLLNVVKSSDVIINNILKYLLSVSTNKGVTIILVIFSIYSSSSLYFHLLVCLENITKIAFNYRLEKRVIAILITPLILTVIYLFLIIISMIKNSYIKYLLMIIMILSILIFINMIALKTLSLKNVGMGVLFSFFYIIIFTILLIIYLKFFSFKKLYGVFAGVLILFFYIYINIVGVLFGIVINCKKIPLLDVFKR